MCSRPFCVHILSHTCRALFSLEQGLLVEKGIYKSSRGLLEKMTCKAGLVLGQEGKRGSREITFIGHMLDFRQLTQLSLYIWKASAAKRGVGSL